MSDEYSVRDWPEAMLSSFESISEAAKIPLEEILPYLAHPDAQIRRLAIKVLYFRHDPKAIDALSPLLLDSDISLAGEAAIAIARNSSDLNQTIAQIPLLIYLLMIASTIEWLERDAIRILSVTGDPRVAKSLINAISRFDVDAKLYGPVREGLILIGRPAIVYVIEALDNVADHLSWQREVAVEVLGEIGDDRAIDPLIHAMQNDDSHPVQILAAESLAKIGSQRAVEPLIGMLSNNDKFLQRAVVKALGKLKDKAAIEPLKNMLNSPDNDIRDAASKSLAQLDSDNPLNQ